MSEDEEPNFHVKSYYIQGHRNYDREVERFLQREQEFLGPEWVLVNCVPIGDNWMHIYGCWVSTWRKLVD